MQEEQETNQELAQVSRRGVGLTTLSNWLRWSLTAILLAAIVICLLLYWAYVNDPTHAASPTELGLSGLLIFCITALAVINVPWHELGYRIKKVGSVEFEQALNAQVLERAEGINFLEKRIEAIENSLEKKSIQSSDVFRQMYEPRLRKLLLDFLSVNDQLPFSPLRIREWGSQQPGFEGLKKFEIGLIKHVLGKMVAERVLETTISKKGNTLYRIVE